MVDDNWWFGCSQVCGLWVKIADHPVSMSPNAVLKKESEKSAYWDESNACEGIKWSKWVMCRAYILNGIIFWFTKHENELETI